MFTAILVHQVNKIFGSPNGMHRNRVAGLRQGMRNQTARIQETPIVALSQVSFTVESSQIFGILGPEGSGKSTLLQMVATFLQPDQGEIQVFGYDVVRQAAQVRRVINRIASAASFFKKYSPLENLLYNARYYGLSDFETRRWAVEILHRLGLDEQTIQTPMELLPRSLRPLISIAQALISKPRLLLLDEPTIGLLEASKQQVYQVLRTLSAEQGMTVLVTTTDWAEANQKCDNFVALEHGRVIKASHPEQGEGTSDSPIPNLTGFPNPGLLKRLPAGVDHLSAVKV